MTNNAVSRLLYTEKNLPWVPEGGIVETYLANELPSPTDCAAAYAFVFKNEALLQTELCKGERPERGYDIPGGHIEQGETIENCVIRETFEETGVRVKTIKFVGYKKVILTKPKPKNYKYPYPISYMAFYLCEILEETPFIKNSESHGRGWLTYEELKKTTWGKDNIIFINEVIKLV